MTDAEQLLPAPFGAGLAGEYFRWHSAGELRLQRCARCTGWTHPPQHRCSACGSAELDWTPVAGRAQLYSWAVTERAFHPAFAGVRPLITAIVALDEGPRIVAMLRDIDAADLAPGLRLRARPEPRADGTAVMVFGPDEDGA